MQYVGEVKAVADDEYDPFNPGFGVTVDELKPSGSAWEQLRKRRRQDTQNRKKLIELLNAIDSP